MLDLIGRRTISRTGWRAILHLTEIHIGEQKCGFGANLLGAAFVTNALVSQDQIIVKSRTRFMFLMANDQSMYGVINLGS